jgi:lipopolysaccharide transport system ATP-binding protein
MGNLSITVRELGKQYRLGARRPHYQTLREALTRAATAPYRRLAGMFGSRDPDESDSRESIWALKNVSFDVNHGDVVGLIGRNGAGKSTLLKILSRITDPTTGFAEIRGRVGSLLEVGTGFHSELTGREKVRRDRGVRRGRAIHRHAGQALLERHVPAPGLCGRRAPRARGPAGR